MFIPVSGCVCRSPSALLCPGVYYTVKTDLSVALGEPVGLYICVFSTISFCFHYCIINAMYMYISTILGKLIYSFFFLYNLLK